MGDFGAFLTEWIVTGSETGFHVSVERGSDLFYRLLGPSWEREIENCRPITPIEPCVVYIKSSVIGNTVCRPIISPPTI